MTPSIPKVVFDCVIYAQAMISDSGPAAACLERVRAGELRLIWSDYFLHELRELPEKLPVHLGIVLSVLRTISFGNELSASAPGKHRSLG